MHGTPRRFIGFHLSPDSKLCVWNELSQTMKVIQNSKIKRENVRKRQNKPTAAVRGAHTLFWWSFPRSGGKERHDAVDRLPVYSCQGPNSYLSCPADEGFNSRFWPPFLIPDRDISNNITSQHVTPMSSLLMRLPSPQTLSGNVRSVNNLF